MKGGQFMNKGNDQKKYKYNIVPPKFSWKVWSIFFLTFLSVYIFVFLSSITNDEDRLFNLIPLIISAFIGAFTFYGGYYLIKRSAYINTLQSLDIENVNEKAESLQEALEVDFFNNLVKINFKYLDKYYLQTQVQANKSFWMSVFAAVVGFIIIIIGIILMFFDKTNPAYITTATGVISESIAAIFFYLYNKTIIKMSDYHQKLVVTQNISLALKISQELPENDRVKSQVSLINSLTQNVNKYLVNSE